MHYYLVNALCTPQYKAQVTLKIGNRKIKLNFNLYNLFLVTIFTSYNTGSQRF